MTPLGRRPKCLRIRSEKRRFGILCQREAELARCGAVERPPVERPPRSNPPRNVAFANPRCRCDCESELKMEIPP